MHSPDSYPRWEEKKEGNTIFSMYVDSPRIYSNSVFYNPKMTINRDFTLLTLYSLFSESDKALLFLDAFAGTGVRGYRIINELKNVNIRKIILNDINSSATQIIRKNVSKMALVDIISITQKDANDVMIKLKTEKERVNVIDLDPFGSPIEFIDAAARLLYRTEGFLFITATDLQVLCGKFPEACLRVYSAIPTRNYLCHEVAIRILLYNLLITAGRLGLAIEPQLSYHYEHFLRVKIKFSKNKELSSRQHKKIGFVDYCTNCSYYRIRPYPALETENRCPNCKKQLETAGPMWLGELYNKKLIRAMLSKIDDLDLPTKNIIRKYLSYMLNEVENPMFYYIPYLKRQFNKDNRLKITDLVSKIAQVGFIASRTIFEPNGIKTNAPYHSLKEIIKEQ